MIFKKRTRYTKINLNDLAIFWKLKKKFFVREKKLEMIKTIILYCK